MTMLRSALQACEYKCAALPLSYNGKPAPIATDADWDGEAGSRTSNKRFPPFWVNKSASCQ